MVAEYRTAPGLPLLVEPDSPPTGLASGSWWQGYRVVGQRENARRERSARDDVPGAEAQWIVVRHLLTSARRKELVRDYCRISTGGLSVVCEGVQWASYTAPIFRALARLGVGEGPGRWTGNTPARPVEIGRACLALLEQAADVIDGKPTSVEERDQLLADMRLLAAVRPFEPWGS